MSDSRHKNLENLEEIIKALSDENIEQLIALAERLNASQALTTQ